MNNKLILAMALSTGLNAFASDVTKLTTKEVLNIEKLKLEKVKDSMRFLDNFQMGDLEGNGGDALVCGSGENQTVEFLDLFEADYGLNIFYNPADGQWERDLGADDLTVIEKVLYALEKIKKIDIKRYQLYSSWALDFESQIRFINHRDDGRDFELGDVPDTGNVITPIGCELKQLIIQNENRINKSFFYQVDKKLWDKLDDNHKAAVILHEVIYRDMFTQTNYAHTTSVATRHLNALLTSKQIYNYTTDYKKYNELLTGLDAYQKVDELGRPLNNGDDDCDLERSFVYDFKSSSLKCIASFKPTNYTKYKKIKEGTSLEFINLPFIETSVSESELLIVDGKYRGRSFKGWTLLGNFKNKSLYENDFRFKHANLNQLTFTNVMFKQDNDEYTIRSYSEYSSIDFESMIHSARNAFSVSINGSEKGRYIQQIVVNTKDESYKIYSIIFKNNPLELLDKNNLLEESYNKEGELISSKVVRTNLEYAFGNIYTCDGDPAEIVVDDNTKTAEFAKGTCFVISKDREEFVIDGISFSHDPDLNGVVGTFPATARLEQNVKKLFKTKYKKGRIVRLNKDGKILGYK